MNPLVSIIIPNYNYARYLPQRIKTILEQTYTNTEIICLDDNSTDNSLEIINQYQEYFDKIIINKKNSGSPFYQWQNGVKHAQGKYIWIAEADDFSDPTFLEKMISRLESNPKLGLAYCQSVPVDPNGKIIESFNYLQYTDFLHPTRWAKDFTNQGQQEINSFLALICTIINVSSVVFKKEAIVNNIDTTFRQSADWMTYIKVLASYDIAYLVEKLNFHREHPARQTNNTVINLVYFKEMLRVYRYLNRHFSLSPQMKKKQFEHILYQWDDHYDGNFGKITQVNNLKLAGFLLQLYPLKVKTIFKQYLKTLQ